MVCICFVPFLVHTIGAEQIQKIFPKIYVTTVAIGSYNFLFLHEIFVTFDTLRIHFTDVFFISAR